MRVVVIRERRRETEPHCTEGEEDLAQHAFSFSRVIAP
jgi:hypothetical protein